MVINRETFRKSERLCSTKIITELFENGNVFHTSHFKVLWIISPVILPSPAQVALSVPKKIFRLAVSRNTIKRRFREAYRKKKLKLYEHLRSKDVQLAFMVIYRQSGIPEYPIMEKSVDDIIETLCKHIG